MDMGLLYQVVTCLLPSFRRYSFCFSRRGGQAELIWGGKIRSGKRKGKEGKRGFVQRLVVNTPLRRSGMARVLKESHST